MENEQPQPVASEPKRLYLLHLISTHPFGTCVAFIGALASIVALMLAFVPWWTAPKPDLCYCIYPIRIPIVQTSSTNPSDVSVSYKGKPVSGNVTAAELAIWNAGRQPIRSEGILSPLIVTVADGAPLFETALSKASREVTECSLINHGPIDMISGKRLGPSSVELKFRILEHNDGVRLRVVYAGTVDAPISLKGVIEGQQFPREVKVAAGRQASLLDVLFSIVLAATTSGIGVCMVIAARKDLRSVKPQRHSVKARLAAVFVIMCAAVIIVSGLAYAITNVLKAFSLPASPFGF